MTVALLYTVTCASGHRNEGYGVRTIRINHRSLVATTPGVGLIPRDCAQCGARLPITVDAVALVPEHLDRVNAWRAKRGWPAISNPNLTTAGVAA